MSEKLTSQRLSWAPAVACSSTLRPPGIIFISALMSSMTLRAVSNQEILRSTPNIRLPVLRICGEQSQPVQCGPTVEHEHSDGDIISIGWFITSRKGQAERHALLGVQRLGSRYGMFRGNSAQKSFVELASSVPHLNEHVRSICSQIQRKRDLNSL